MNSMLVRAYVALGSNLQDPVKQIRRAVSAMDELPGTCCVAASSLYRSAPLGPQDQAEYVNAVAAIDTRLSAHDLLVEMQRVETRHGRMRHGERWGPRTLDLDLLLYGDETHEDEKLTVPHPGLPERNFVLYPLREIAPWLHIPGLGSLEALVGGCPDVGLQPLAV